MKIERQKNFGREVHDPRAINITFGVDAAFVPIMGVCLTSILKNNPAQKFTFHVFLDAINPPDEKKISELCAQFPSTQIILYFLPPDLYSELYLEGDYTKAIFYRIVAADFLAQSLNKMLYMDSDMICLKPLDELINLPMEEFFVAAVADPGVVNTPLHKNNFGFNDKYLYFNSGLMYLNLQRWRKEKVSAQMLNIMSRREYPFPDQDAINLVADLNNYPVKYLPDKFNHFFRVNGVEQPMRDDVVIQHFTGQLKPWFPWCESPLKKLYDSYQEISPWRDFVYQPRNYQEHRLMGRACRRKGEWLEAFKWYWSYLKRRRIEKKSKRD